MFDSQIASDTSAKNKTSYEFRQCHVLVQLRKVRAEASNSRRLN